MPWKPRWILGEFFTNVRKDYQVANPIPHYAQSILTWGNNLSLVNQHILLEVRIAFERSLPIIPAPKAKSLYLPLNQCASS